MEKSSIHEKGTVQSEPETQKGRHRGRHIHPSRGGHIRALTLPLGQVTPLAAQAVGTGGFSETALRSTLQAVADRARATPEDISQAIADGWSQGVKHAMRDGTLTADEEENLRTFRDRMADQDLPSVITGSTTLDRASAERITRQAKRAALAHGGGGTLQELDNTLRRTMMSNRHRQQLLIRSWEEE